MPVIGYFPSGSGGSAAVISTLPSQSGELVYTGFEQSPTWNDYDENELAISGETSATDAGTYTATFTPQPGYYWSSGTAEGRDVEWTIARVQGSISVEQTEYEIGWYVDVEVTRFGDGDLVAEVSDSKILSCTINGTTLTVRNLTGEREEGDVATVTVYAEETLNVERSNTITLTFTTVMHE